MLYTKQELMMFSLIYSSLEKGRFPKQEIDIVSLYKIFNRSIEYNKNLFALNSEDKIKFIKDTMKSLKVEKPRLKIEARENKLIDLFSSKERMAILEKQAILELSLCKKNDIKHINYFSREYPNNLKTIETPPFNIFFKGKIPTDTDLNKSLAIIGSRKPETKYGKAIALSLGKKLAKNNWINISGLAIGCDEYGHIGSLRGKGITGAILAQGLNTPIYPKENKELSEKILENDGFLMSEIPPSIKIEPLFLTLRDRLQSGITRGVFVIQTSCNSGTLHTVKYSLEQNRKTYIWDPRKIKDIELKSIEGNLSLINEDSKKMNVSISKKLKKGIIPIESFEKLKKQLIELETIGIPKVSFNRKTKKDNILEPMKLKF